MDTAESGVLDAEQENREIFRQLPEQLLPWFAAHARELPWRQDREPYHIWLSEIMLQQTRVEAVKGYYRRFLEALPDIAALAEAQEDVLLKLWEGLGYYSRVRNLQKAARQIMEQHGGVFPTQYRDILALPGIGAYTAGAIASICFDAPTPAVDGNVLRVISRMTENEADILATATKRQMAVELAAVYPQGPRAYTFNQSLIELGATVCLPNGEPKCQLCPMAAWCKARRHGTWSQLPRKAAKKKRTLQKKTVFLLHTPAGAVAVEKRQKTGLLAGLWQFPNVEGHLTAQQALDQAAAWGVGPVHVEKSCTGTHIFTHVEWDMVCYHIDCQQEDARFHWASHRALEQEIALPTAFRMFWEPKL